MGRDQGAPEALAARAALLMQPLLCTVKGKHWRFSQCRGRKQPGGSPGIGVKPAALPARWDQPWWQRAARGPAASEGIAPGRVQGPHYGVATACSPGGQHRGCHQWGSHPARRCIFLLWLVLPGEGAFPALPWSDSVIQCQRHAAPVVRPRSWESLGSASWRVWAPVAGGCPGRQQAWWVTQLTGTWTFEEVRLPVSEHPGVSSVPWPCLLIPGISAGVSSGAPLRDLCSSPSSPLWFLAGAEQLGCAAGVLAGKAQPSRPLHKAALFRTNPPRIGLHFCQVIHQHVNGKGWSPLNQ